MLEVTLEGNGLQQLLELVVPFRIHLLPLLLQPRIHLRREILPDLVDVLLGEATGVRSSAPAPLLLPEHVLPAREVRAVGPRPPRMFGRPQGGAEDVIRALRHERSLTRFPYLLFLQ